MAALPDAAATERVRSLRRRLRPRKVCLLCQKPARGVWRQGLADGDSVVGLLGKVLCGGPARAARAERHLVGRQPLGEGECFRLLRRTAVI